MIENTIKNFSDKAKKDAVEYCRKLLPYEGCGIISEDNFIPFDNKSSDPLNNFLIDDREFDYLLMRNKIQAIIHSHNDFPHASLNDQRAQREFDLPFGIINFRHGTCQHFIFWGDQLEKEPLLKRPFFFGVFDCLTLSSDYYKEKFNKEIPQPLREVNYWENDQSIFEDHVNMADYPVNFINIKDVKPNDIYFYKMFDSKYINHMAVVLENGRLLQHFMNKLSCTLPASYYQNYICYGGRFDLDWETYNE